MAFGDFTVVRSTVKRVLNSSGVLAEVAINTPAFEFNAGGSYKGLLVEPAGTNLALHSRDLTNVVWSATNVTPAKTATGADGASNGATTLTATDANGTILQSITSASSARVFSAFVRRRTGVGVVEITQDNGSTWTAMTLTSTFTKFSTPAQTTTNPIVGFRIVTSGDEIDVDFTQAETGAVATSPIPTTGSTANRTADSVTLTGASSLIGQTEGTIYVEVDWQEFASNPARIILELSANAQNRVVVYQSESPSPELRMFIISDNVIQTNQGVSTSGYAGVKKIAFAYKHNDCALYVDGASESTDTSVDLSALATLTTADLGQDLLATAQFNGWIRSVAIFPTALSESQAIELTTL